MDFPCWDLDYLDVTWGPNLFLLKEGKNKQSVKSVLAPLENDAWCVLSTAIELSPGRLFIDLLVELIARIKCGSEPVRR